MERSKYIDITPDNSRAPSSVGSRMGASSPRIQHLDGDIPPSLSPLDAFAAHSRKLAKELEETRLAGQRRMSRLAPQIVTQSLTEHQANRPAIFRSLSSNVQDFVPPVLPFDIDTAASNPDIRAPTFRPASTYPRISAVVAPSSHTRSQSSTPVGQEDSKQAQDQHQNYFEGVRAESPEPIENEFPAEIKVSTEMADHYRALLPPSAAFARSRPYHESSDDDYTSSNAGSFFSQVRKLSSSSNVSAPFANSAVHNRSSSNNSSASLGGHKQTPSHLNFSRPRSSASSYTKVDSPTKSQPRLVRKTSQMSELSQTHRSFDDSRSANSDGVLSYGPSSYTHSRFQLPRGRNVDRNSGIFSDTPPNPYQEWTGPASIASPALSAEGFSEVAASPLEVKDQERTSLRSGKTGFSFEFDRERNASSDQINQIPSYVPSTSLKALNSIGGRPHNYYGAQKIPELPPIPGSTYESTIDGMSRSSRSNSTVRPSTSRSVSNYTNLTPEDHVTKAIDLHQHGDLKESTYHLRIAAKNNHPTGMLLYALACRHGWGMRPTPKEGVAWLRKAMDCAMLEMAEDEKENSDRPKADVHQKREHKAQFALSIYELGVSHLKGWGVEQDKALALRCFEIAGTWGDADALSEAGFCYAEGVGCKKDLRKAARFYRQAAEKGVSMVGNSWIYKEKYNEPEKPNRDSGDRGREADSPKKGSSSAGRSKSKTRSIFGRKKSMIGLV